MCGIVYLVMFGSQWRKNAVQTSVIGIVTARDTDSKWLTDTDTLWH